MNFYELFLKPYETYTNFQIFLEATAAIFGLLSVYFSIKKNIWVYPTGIVSTALYVYILFNFGLLGDAMINVYYTIMSIYRVVEYRPITLRIESFAFRSQITASWKTNTFKWGISLAVRR